MDHGIFISYRREDSEGHTRALYGALRERFGTERLFLDVDTIEPGIDFAQRIKDAVGRCDVLIVVVGQDWLDAQDESGARRLDDKNDYVRLEITTALEREIRVIPVLLGDVPMPSEKALPEPLKLLSRRSAVRLLPEYFDAGVARLMAALSEDSPAESAETGKEKQEQARRRVGTPVKVALIAAGTTVIAALIGIAPKLFELSLPSYLPSGVSRVPVDLFERAGYHLLIPNRDEAVPGLFFTVQRPRNSQVSLYRTCEIPFAEIEPFIEKTRTVDEQISRELEAGYEADTSVLSTDGTVALEGVKQVQVRYNNPVIWYLTTDSLYHIRKKYLRGACQAAIKADLMKGLSVYQVSKVIVSDIVFEITYDSGTRTKVTAPADSGSIGVSAEGAGSHDIQVKRMFHAVDLDDSYSLTSSDLGRN